VYPRNSITRRFRRLLNALACSALAQRLLISAVKPCRSSSRSDLLAYFGQGSAVEPTHVSSAGSLNRHGEIVRFHLGHGWAAGQL
jgi:hypothetical protein